MDSIYLKPSGRRYYISFFIAFIILSVLLFLAAPLLPQFNIYQTIFAMLVLNFIASAIAFLYFQQQYIHAEDDIVSVKEGIFTSKMVVIPFNKIEEVKTQYTAVDRILGVGTVMLDTAGTSGMEVIFSNVPQQSIIGFIAMFKRYREAGGKPKAGQEEGEKGGLDTW